MKKSITVTVRKKDGLLDIPRGSSSPVTAPLYRILGLPDFDKYKVTYTPDPRGPFLVMDSDYGWPIVVRANVKDRQRKRFVCFLRPFVGLRVSRRVEPVKK